MEQITGGYIVYSVTGRSRIASVAVVILISTGFETCNCKYSFYAFSGVTSNASWNTEPSGGM